MISQFLAPGLPEALERALARPAHGDPSPAPLPPSRCCFSRPAISFPEAFDGPLSAVMRGNIGHDSIYVCDTRTDVAVL